MRNGQVSLDDEALVLLVERTDVLEEFLVLFAEAILGEILGDRSPLSVDDELLFLPHKQGLVLPVQVFIELIAGHNLQESIMVSLLEGVRE